MASLIVKKLMKLNPGARIQLTYAGRKELTATVSETDNEESFALLTEDGEEVLVTFAEVTSFKELEKEAGPAPKPEPEPQPVPAPAPEPSPAARPEPAP